MRTSKPIATISYNTEEFLKLKLEELCREHKVSDYMYIKHDAEKDERKDHIHLYIQPNRLIDTMDLQDFLMELDPNNPMKPLGCIDFRPSKADDWILYAQHYQPYLASKGEAREFSYHKEDFRYHNEDSFEDMYKHAFKGSDWARRWQILEKLQDTSQNPLDLIYSGVVPLQQATQVNAIYSLRQKTGYLDRGGREGHE